MKWFAVAAFTGAGLFAGCGSKAEPSAPATDAVSTDDVAVDAAAGTDANADVGKDVAKDVAKDVPIPECKTRGGAYIVDGICNSGESSIPFACLQAKDCDLTWITDYRTWSGKLSGLDYSLTNQKGDETIAGNFTSADSGKYSYDSGSVHCDATFNRLDPTQADSLCCDVMAQDCKAGDACVVVSEKPGTDVIFTTGCIPLASSVTVEGGNCAPSASQSACQKGSLCVLTPGSTSSGKCVKQCQKSSDCGGLQCSVVTTAPRSGICQSSCAPFSDETGSPCASGETCVPTTVVNDSYVREIGTSCQGVGTGGKGATCTYTSDCGGGLVCTSGGCASLCDTKHPCAAGSKCTDFGIPNSSTAPAGFGFCK